MVGTPNNTDKNSDGAPLAHKTCSTRNQPITCQSECFGHSPDNYALNAPETVTIFQDAQAPAGADAPLQHGPKVVLTPGNGRLNLYSALSADLIRIAGALEMPLKGRFPISLLAVSGFFLGARRPVWTLP
jgi:hypothetical protein